MDKFFKYRGFKGIVEYSYEDKCLFGKVIDIDDIVLFEITNPEKAYDLFRIAVNDYISLKGECSKKKENIQEVKAHKYVVAQACGGVMEDPVIHYEDYQEVIAESKEEACKIYNDRNNCNYYYGVVVDQIY